MTEAVTLARLMLRDWDNLPRDVDPAAIFETGNGLRNLISTLLAENERRTEVANLDGWEPIETAPKDGTEIDVWCAESGGFRIPSVIWEKRYGAFFNAEEGVLGGDLSHWRPLPRAPGRPRELAPGSGVGSIIVTFARGYEAWARAVCHGAGVTFTRAPAEIRTGNKKRTHR